MTTPTCLTNPPTPDKQSTLDTAHKYFIRSKVAKPAINTDQANAVLNIETG